LQPDDPKCEQSLSAFVRNASESELSPQTAEPRHVVPNLTESELSGSHEKHLGTNTITADYDSVHHRAAAERRARAAERAWKSARVWRTTDLETFVKLAAAGRPFGSGGGLLLSLAAAAFVGRLAVARGRRKLDKTMGASAEL
jgi:hypothetical protein